MDFVEYMKDQQRNLQSEEYVNMLWGKIKDNCSTISVSIEVEEQYKHHIPIEFTRFLKSCVKKLRDLKIGCENVNWADLDDKYWTTLVYFAIEQEDISMDNALYASDVFFLVNSVCPASKQSFHEVLYLKIMQVLIDFNRCQDMTSNIIIYVMDDFKTYLSKFMIPGNVIIPTASVLHEYSYCCNDVFDDISVDVSFENLGYIAFVGFKILAKQLSHRKNDKKLFPLLLALTSSLKSATMNNLSRTVKVAHQKNVQLYIKQNFNLFSANSVCLVTDMLKFVCLNTEFDDYDAIAQLIQQLPHDTHRSFITFLQNALHCDDVEFKRNTLNLLLPILNYPAEHETDLDRQLRAEVFMESMLHMCADANQEIRQRSLSILAEYSDTTKGQSVLKKILTKDETTFNKESIMANMYKITDKHWHKKATNVDYINLTCNILITLEDFITIRTLNRLRNLCHAASPYDLKPCIFHLKRLLQICANKSNVVIYVLSIFVHQMFHLQSTSAAFAKELGGLVFSHISLSKEDNFVWNIVNYLLSSNFDVLGIFTRFNDLQMIKGDVLKILIKHKIDNDDVKIPALKLLCVMFHFVNCREYHYLEQKLERLLVGDNSLTSDTEIYLIIYALIKVLEKKKRSELTEQEINSYRQLQFLVSQAFFDQSLPVTCVKYAILLLSVYTRLIDEDTYWDTTALSHFQEDLLKKLKAVRERELEDSLYLTRDAVYIAELIVIRRIELSSDVFQFLEEIMKAEDYSVEFSGYIRSHQEILALCMLLYVKACFINEDLVPNCVRNLEMIMFFANDYLRLHIIYALHDMCSMHLQYYDPIVPHLFSALYSKNGYIRFVSSKILMQLISDEHLRLIDGQYFLFMGLLADEKDIIARNVQMFIKEKYSKKFSQTIARYFVPSIIHYNLYYVRIIEHPTIALSQPDQDLLKKRIYSWNDRSFIYYYLYQFLPDSLKFNILNQISSEIIARILQKTVVHSAEMFRILEDALCVILFTVPKTKIGNIADDRKFYEAEMKHIDGDLLVADHKSSEVIVPTEQRTVLKNLLTSLIQLLYSEVNQNPNICQNLLFTIIALTKSFYAAIKRVIHEDSSLLKRLYKELHSFYVKMKDQFEYCLLTVNPCNLSTASENEDVEFYLHEFTQFSLLPPKIIIGIE